MKTRVYNFGQLFISLVFCMSMAACNKGDYYEKEFLDNPYQEEPTNDGTVNGGSQAGDNSGIEGGTQGGVDSGVDGGTSGGTTTGSTSTGGTDGSATGGVSGTVTGGTDGSTTGGVSGTVTGGTDGSTTGGVSGTVTGGTDGSTTGGTVTGSTSGGATTGGTTTGGTTTGGTTTGGQAPAAVEEIFHQATSQTKKLDIMWIVDNSGSMANVQTNLGTNFSSFIQDFINKDVDFKMAITTTDTVGSNKGLMVTGSEAKLNSTAAHNNPTQFMSDFKRMVKVGTSGSGNEKGLEASEGFMSRYASSFLRPDAYLAVVIVSDEEDQSPKTTAQYSDYLKSFKSTAGLVKVYSIVDKNMVNHGSGVTVGFQRYAAVSNSTSGTISDIYDDFYHSLDEMGTSIINLLDSFALAQGPIDGSLKVYVNGVLVTNYTYDAASHSIKFDSNSLPAVGSEIKVQYLK